MKNKIRNDILLAIGVIAIAIISLLVVNLTKSEGNKVNVLVDGKVKYTYNLNENTKQTIKTNNNGINELVIENNNVSISYANCRDKICQNHKPISNKGETIVCLPHKVVIEISE